ncbi:MAG: DUF2461 domain-containing protein [Muribaculaceae bacterium]|nr:DUF2461 domain-containing protein [Muribaculaceae bacterium]
MKQIYSFLKSLARHNDREWFNAHKDQYLQVKKVADDFAENLLAALAAIEPQAALLTVKDVTYRIYRDTRFSSDKSPYKTHIGIFINPPKGKKSLRYGYYFHLEPGASLICAGNMPGPSRLTKMIRQDIYDNIDEWLSIVESPEFKTYFPTVGSDPLKMAPKGFDKNWKYIDYLKPRDFGAYMEVSDDFYTAPDLIDRLVPVMVQMKRLNDFINYTVDIYEETESSDR